MAPPIHRAAYDGDGVRRKRDDSNGTVHYLGGYERNLAADSNSSDTVTKYYSASLGALSRPVAFRRGGTLHWVGSDHLGGTIRVLDDSFTAVDGMRYKPYGEDRDTGSSLNDRKFTGQTEDLSGTPRECVRPDHRPVCLAGCASCRIPPTRSR